VRDVGIRTTIKLSPIARLRFTRVLALGGPMPSSPSLVGGRIGRQSARKHVDGIELDDDRADLIEDDQQPGMIRRNILWGT
jgi:hypothetical protein